MYVFFFNLISIALNWIINSSSHSTVFIIISISLLKFNLFFVYFLRVFWIRLVMEAYINIHYNRNNNNNDDKRKLKFSLLACILYIYIYLFNFIHAYISPFYLFIIIIFIFFIGKLISFKSCLARYIIIISNNINITKFM